MIKKILLILAVMLIPFNLAFADNISKAYEINIKGIITNGTYEYIKSTIDNASKDNSSIVIIKLNTPGGLLDSTREIVTSILSSTVPVVVYVAPAGARAASAGAFILLSADYAIMEDGTNVGAAHPVSSSGEDIEGAMQEKVVNDTVALIKSIAEKRGRNIDVATSMVVDSKSFTASEALKNQIIDSVIVDGMYIENIKKHFNITTDIEIIKVEMTTLQKFISFLANPNILVALFFFGILMIGLELKAPGTFVFLGIGAASLILFAVGSNIISINIFGLVLMIFGVFLLILELFIVSFGVLSISAIISMVAGLLMLFDGENNMGISVSYVLIFFIIGSFAAIVLVIGRLLLSDFKRKSVSGGDALIDQSGEVLAFDTEKSKGKMFINGEIWNIISDDNNIIEGDTVTVIARDNLTLKVKK